MVTQQHHHPNWLRAGGRQQRAGQWVASAGPAPIQGALMRTKATAEGAAIPFLSVSVAWTSRMSPDPPRTSGPSSPCNDNTGGREAAVRRRLQKSQADKRRHRLCTAAPPNPLFSAVSARGQCGCAAEARCAHPARPVLRAWWAGTGQMSPGRRLGLGCADTNSTRAHCSEDTSESGSGGHGTLRSSRSPTQGSARKGGTFSHTR